MILIGKGRFEEILMFMVGGFDLCVILYFFFFKLFFVMDNVLFIKDLNIFFCNILVLIKYVFWFIWNILSVCNWEKCFIKIDWFRIFRCICFGRILLLVFFNCIFCSFNFFSLNGIIVLNLFGVIIFNFCFVFVWWINLMLIFKFLDIFCVCVFSFERMIFKILFMIVCVCFYRLVENL